MGTSGDGFSKSGVRHAAGVLTDEFGTATGAYYRLRPRKITVRQLVRNSLAENSEPQLSEASSWYGLRTTSAGHFLRLFETEIFETYDGNRRALFVTFDGAPEPEVIQPSAKVIQHDGERGTEKRISQLESQIDQLRSIIF